MKVAEWRAIRTPYVPEHPHKVLFLVRSLARGGAERQLTNLAIELHRKGVPVSVAVYYPGGDYEVDLRAVGIPVHSLGKRSRFETVGFFRRLLRLVQRERPALVHSYLPTSNLFAALVKVFIPDIKVVWGVRDTKPVAKDGRLFHTVIRLERRLGRLADLVIYNSSEARRHYESNGFDPARNAVISNGIDVERFQPRPESRERTREAWEFTPDDVVVGMAARYVPKKNYPLFIEAASLLTARNPRLRFVCVGRGPASFRHELEVLAASLSPSPNVQILDERSDMEHVYPALDVLVLPSSEEGFPNVVAEAMACGVPCAVTNVGDSAIVVGDEGEVAEAIHPEAVARALERLLARLSPELSARCRERVVNEFTLERLADRTLDLLQKVAA